jgi:hypothetical protein
VLFAPTWRGGPRRSAVFPVLGFAWSRAAPPPVRIADFRDDFHSIQRQASQKGTFITVPSVATGPAWLGCLGAKFAAWKLSANFFGPFRDGKAHGWGEASMSKLTAILNLNPQRLIAARVADLIEVRF